MYVPQKESKDFVQVQQHTEAYQSWSMTFRLAIYLSETLLPRCTLRAQVLRIQESPGLELVVLRFLEVENRGSRR